MCFYFKGRILGRESCLAHHAKDWLEASRSRHRTRKVLNRKNSGARRMRAGGSPGEVDRSR
jgi:hypothetical protein